MIFLVDKTEVTYEDLVKYVSGTPYNSGSTLESETLEFIKKVSNGLCGNVDELLRNVKSSTVEFTVTTSGTSGRPKEVKHNVLSLTKSVKVDGVVKTWGSVYQSGKMAFYQVLFQSLFNKCTLVNLNGYCTEDVYSRLLRYNVKYLSGTPTFYKMLLSLRKELPSVTQVTLGGEPSDEKLFVTLARYFPNAKVTNVYASTEVGALFASNSNTFKVSNKVKLVDNNLYVHKDYVKVPFEGDWYNTGDVVQLVSDYEFVVLGKQEKEVKVSGVKVNLSTVEHTLNSLPYVLDSYVYSRKNSLVGNVLCADVVLSDNSTKVHTVKSDLSTKLNKYEVPSVVKFVKQLKTNENMKKVAE